MKRWLTSALMGFLWTTAYAQKVDVLDGQWHHQLGYDYTIGVDLSTLAIPFTSNGLTYMPRYTLPVGEELGLGLAAPLGLGLAQSINGNLSLAHHYTLAASLQAGMGSTVESNSLLGAFVNLGFGSFARFVRNYNNIGPAFIRDGSTGVYGELGVRYDYRGNEVSLSAALWRVPASAVGKADVVSLRLLYGTR